MRAERTRIHPAAADQYSPASHSGPGPSARPTLAQAREHYLAGRIAEALDTLDALLHLGSTPDSAGLVVLPGAGDAAAAALLRAWCLLELKRHDDCLGWLTTAQERGLLPGDHPGRRVLELNILLFQEEYKDVQAGVEDLLPQVADPADPDHAELRLLLGASLRWQGRLEEAVGHVEFACAAFTVLGQPGRTAVAANFLGWTYLSLGRLDEARRWFEKSLDLHCRLNATVRMAQNYQNLSIVCYKQGDYPLAEELLEKEIKLVGDRPDMKCRAWIALGNVKRLRGDFAKARASLLEAFSLAAECKLVREQALALEFLGDVFRDEGNLAEAREYYRRGLDAARTLAPRGDLVMELMRREGECLDLDGEHEEAQFLLNDALQLGNVVNDRFELAVIRRCLGVNAANLGRWKQAAALLEQALQELRQLGARHEIMLASRHLGRVLLRQVDSGNAGATGEQLLEQAWRHALAAQQLSQELDTPAGTGDINDLVGELARRRLLGGITTVPTAPFSSRRVPCTRVLAVSGLFQQVLKRCDGFSRYKNPVLLMGESGTGKELLARRIHENSPRGASPFIRVSCAASSAEDLGREIFGAAAGARPGARRALPGLVSQVEGGTLFLHGIEDLPRDLQTRLLRLMQEGIYRPVGDSREHLANIRLIAACETDLGGLTDQGLFRQDLYFRLKQMCVIVPSLRERPEDIMPLLDHFLTRLNGSPLAARDIFDFQGLAALTEHRWPGNAAEVEAIAQRAWLNRNLGRPVRLRLRQGPRGADLDFVEEGADFRPAQTTPSGRHYPAGHQSGMTWSSLNTLIERAGGNKARVARNLGVSRITLYRWLKQMDPGAM